MMYCVIIIRSTNATQYWGRFLRAASAGAGCHHRWLRQAPDADRGSLTLRRGSSSGKVGNTHTHFSPRGSGVFLVFCMVCLKQLPSQMWFCLLRLTIEPGRRFYSLVQNSACPLCANTWSWFLYSGWQPQSWQPLLELCRTWDFGPGLCDYSGTTALPRLLPSAWFAEAWSRIRNVRFI